MTYCLNWDMHKLHKILYNFYKMCSVTIPVPGATVNLFCF